MICVVLSLLYQNNTTPLYVASQEGHHDIVQNLLGAGAEVNTTTSDVSDMTYVHRVHMHVRMKWKHNMGYGGVCGLECVCA